jgi:ATP-dependent RNA helicase DDX51/DBP6
VCKAESLPIALEEMVEVHPLQPLPQPKPAPKSGTTSTFSALPTWLASPIRVSAAATSPFTELGIPGAVTSFLQSKGFDQAFAVQDAVLPLLLPGARQHQGDVLVMAPTGSGKTLAYVLPMISDISRMSITNLRGLIVMPTRELVYQAHEICEIVSSAFAGRGRRRVRIGMACGDMSYKQELAHLMKAEKFMNPAECMRRKHRANVPWECSDFDSDGENSSLAERERNLALSDEIINYTPKVDILICTPGRLVQHLHNTDGFELKYVHWLVIDEADRLLGQSYQQFAKILIDSFSKGPSRPIRKIILSATLNRDLSMLSLLKLHLPKLVVVEGGEQSFEGDGEDKEGYTLPDSLQEYYLKVKHRADKPLELVRLLKEERLLEFVEGSCQRGVLIFTNSNEAAQRLCRLIGLMEPSFADLIGTITSQIPMSTRKKTLRAFNKKKLSILIASDLVGRGLDIPNLAHVINYDFPATQETYIHRVGRTARAGREGKAWTLHTAKEIQNRVGHGGEMMARPDFDMEARKRYEAALAILAKEAGKA